MKRMLAQESTAQKDKEIIISIVKEMTESMTGAQSTRHWAEDGLDGALVLVIRKRSGIEPCPRSFAERRRPSSIRRFCKPMIIKDLVALTGVEPGFAAF